MAFQRKVGFGSKVLIWKDTIELDNDIQVNGLLIEEFKIVQNKTLVEEIEYALQEAEKARKSAQEIDKDLDSKTLAEKNILNLKIVILYNKAVRRYEFALGGLEELKALGKPNDPVKRAEIIGKQLHCNTRVPSLSFDYHIEKLKSIREYIPEIKATCSAGDQDTYKFVDSLYAIYFSSLDHVNEVAKKSYIKGKLSIELFLKHAKTFYELSKDIPKISRKVEKQFHKFYARAQAERVERNSALSSQDIKQARMHCKKESENMLLAISLLERLKSLGEIEKTEILRREAESYQFLLSSLAYSHTVPYEDYMIYYNKLKTLISENESIKNSVDLSFFNYIEQVIESTSEQHKCIYEAKYKIFLLKEEILFEMQEAAKRVPISQSLTNRCSHYMNASKKLCELFMFIKEACSEEALKELLLPELAEAQLTRLQCLESYPQISYSEFLNELDVLNKMLLGIHPKKYHTLVFTINQFNQNIEKEKGEDSTHKQQYEALQTKTRGVEIGQTFALTPRVEMSIPLVLSSSSSSMFEPVKKPMLKIRNHKAVIVEKHLLDQVLDTLYKKLNAMTFDNISKQTAIKFAGKMMSMIIGIINSFEPIKLRHNQKCLLLYFLLEITFDLGNDNIEENQLKEKLAQEKVVKKSFRYNQPKDCENKDNKLFDLKDFIAKTFGDLIIEIAAGYSNCVDLFHMIAQILYLISQGFDDKATRPPELAENQDCLARILAEAAADLGSHSAKEWLASNPEPKSSDIEKPSSPAAPSV